MSFPTVTKAISKVVFEAKQTVIDELMAYLDNKIVVDDDLKAIFNEFKASITIPVEKVVKEKKGKGKKGKVDSDEEVVEKKKRAPSAFNLFIKDIMPQIKAAHPDVKNGKELMSLAADAWKSDPKGIFIKEKIDELKKENKGMDIVEIYQKAKDLYKNGNKDGEIDPAESEEEEPKPKAKKEKAPKKGKKAPVKVESEDEEDEE